MSSLGIFDKETKTYKKVADLSKPAVIDSAMSDTSTNAVQNKVVKSYVDKKASENVDFSTSTSKILNSTIESTLVLSNATRNLLNTTIETHEINGVTCTNNGDGTYTLNGTATDTCIFWSNTDIFIKKGTYKFVGTPPNISGVSIGGSIYGYVPYEGVVIDIGDVTGRFAIVVTNGTECANAVFKPMLTTDLSATYDDFVPYSGYQIQSCGKNLMSVNDATNGATLDTIDSFNIRIRGLDKGNIASTRIHLGESGVTKGHQSFTFEVTVDEPYGIAIKHNGSTKDIDIEYINYMVRKGTYTISFDVASNNPSVEGGLLLHNIQLERGCTETGFEPYQDGGTVHIDSSTEFPLLGLKSLDGVTNIVSPGNVEVTYAKSDSGAAILGTPEKFVKDALKETTVNLLKPMLDTCEINGVTCTNNGDGTYTLNGTATDAFTFGLCDVNLNKFVHKTCLLIDCGKAANSSRKSLGLIAKEDTTWTWVTANDSNNYKVILNEYYYTKKVSVRIEGVKGDSYNNAIVKPMLTTNLSATYDDFVPYTGDTGKLNGDVAELNKTLSSHTHRKSQITDFPSSLPANGGNSSTVNGHTVNSDVPSGAKFTDTTYNDATTSAHGLMTPAMVSKLNGIAEGANRTTVDTSMSSTSTNPVQNKVIKSYVDGQTGYHVGSNPPENTNLLWIDSLHGGMINYFASDTSKWHPVRAKGYDTPVDLINEGYWPYSLGSGITIGSISATYDINTDKVTIIINNLNITSDAPIGPCDLVSIYMPMYNVGRTGEITAVSTGGSHYNLDMYLEYPHGYIRLRGGEPYGINKPSFSYIKFETRLNYPAYTY